MRPLFAVLLFSSSCFLAMSISAIGQQPDVKKTQQKYDPPKSTKPDEATLKQIAAMTERLRTSIEALKSRKIAIEVVVEVEIYLKAAENIVRFEEWYGESSGRWAILTLRQGLERAELAESNKALWRDSPGAWVVRAYRSGVDRSVQPFAVLLPHNYGKDPKKKWRLDIVLHGRDSSLTEAKFIAAHGTTTKGAPKDLDRVILEVYGRGNNAYRWAGERDVFEAIESFMERGTNLGRDTIDEEQIYLRGFSMGGAGTWHLGLHYPFSFAAIAPGAGFTTTHGYVGGLPKELPDYQEKCLRIYDAVDYAENAFNVPVVAYSGEKDPQKAAADNIEKALKDFKESLHFTHLIAPGLEHQMPKEWQDKAEDEFKKYFVKGRAIPPEHIRFVTYTTRYNFFGHGFIHALEKQYEKAVIDSRWTKDELVISTQNIALVRLRADNHSFPATLRIDGQSLPTKPLQGGNELLLVKTEGKWRVTDNSAYNKPLRKKGYTEDEWLQGPIDDAFTAPFQIAAPAGEGWHPALSQFIATARDRFIYEWDKYFRGKLTVHRSEEIIDSESYKSKNLILLGDPGSNPLIAKILPQLPITWTKEKLVVNGVEYDPTTHLPVLIYPNPLKPDHYVVLNSGHTFHEADFKGTNALLYPRLGDWAVIKPAPTEKDPASFEVVAAGLFDENWRFPKKK